MLNREGQFIPRKDIETGLDSCWNIHLFVSVIFANPKNLETNNEKGDFLIKVKKQDDIFEMVYATHPFDVVGYDGYNFPYAFSIHDFEPITGRIHQPPPVHQTFETDAFVVCSFVPRLYDYHPEAFQHRIIIAILIVMRYCIM